MRVASAAVAIALAAACTSAAAESINQQRLDVLRKLTGDRSTARPEFSDPVEPRAASTCTRYAFWRRSRMVLRLHIEESIQDASALEGIPPTLLRAVIRVESAYDPDAVSHAGAQGLMQLMPDTARELHVVCPFDPRENVMAGARYLRRQYERFGSWPDALAAYNAGPERVERGGVLPTETRHYVRDILALAPVAD